MTNDFFRTNLPYGLKRNSNNQWLAFNREYLPLGWRQRGPRQSIHADDAYSDLPVYAAYRELTEEALRKLAWNDKDAIQLGPDGKIQFVFLYNDRSNPSNNPLRENWDEYFEKLRFLSELEHRNTYINNITNS